LCEKQIYDNFLAAIDHIIYEKSNVLVHAGDLFDTVKPKTRIVYATGIESPIIDLLLLRDNQRTILT
jgi:hypothetical protein